MAHTKKKYTGECDSNAEKEEETNTKKWASKFKTSNFEGELNLSLILLAFAQCKSHKESNIITIMETWAFEVWVVKRIEPPKW